jgi:Xaa-Pro aminopeptidase
VNYAARMAHVRARMEELQVDVLCCSIGADLPYLIGYEAMPLERLTMLVLPRDDRAVLIVPRLEAPRVEEDPSVFALEPWEETDDPIARVAGYVGAARTVAIGDQTWARVVLGLQALLPRARFCSANEVVGPLRAVKDAEEVERLQQAARAVDDIAASLRDRRFIGRSELEIHRDIVELMLDSGHERANFAIVGSGPNSASAHHEPGARVVEKGDVVLCDFGGTMRGYCSDITRMYVAGEPTSEVRDLYGVLAVAQETAVRGARVGSSCEAVDAAARDVLSHAGLAEMFVHRTGHGIGMDAHEDPYVVQGNATPLEPGNAFSVEPGIYLPGRFGLRLEDIVVASSVGPVRLNHAPRDLAVVA